MSAADDTAIEKQNWHWRNSMRPVRFFNMDARAAWAFLLLLVYARWITLFFTILVTTIFRFLESKGLTFPDSLRALRVWFLGDFRPGWTTYRHRKWRDFG